MTLPFAITIPFANVNDETAILVEWLVEDGTRIEAGALVAVIETSKAAVDIESPVRGFLRHTARVGQEIAVGKPLCYVTEQSDSRLPSSAPGASVSPPTVRETTSGILRSPAGEPPQPKNGRPARFTPLARRIADENGVSSQFTGNDRVTTEDVFAALSTRLQTHPPAVNAPQAVLSDDWTTARISARARALMAEHQISLEPFSGRGMIREQDILDFLRSAAGDTMQVRSAPSPAAPLAIPGAERDSTSPIRQGDALRREPVSQRKQTEIRNLTAGLAGTLPNTIVVACPTKGLRAAISQASAIQGSTTAVLIYETARLLRQYPFFNGYYRDNQTHLYEQVHVGFAVDAGKGLKVLVIHDADGKSMTQIAQEIQDLLVDYLNDSLPVRCLTGATFTISDLSGEGVYAFTPLISSGQAAIMGIGSEFFAPGSPYGQFNLMLTFDHQMSEGRQAALFLNDLKSRLKAYEAAHDAISIAAPATPAAGEAPRAEVFCSRCFSTAEHLKRMSAYLVPTIEADGSTRLLCTVCLQGC